MYPKRLVLMIVIALCLLPTASVNAQSDNVWQFVKTKLFDKEYIEIGGQFGVAGYMGDIDNQLFGFDNKNVLGFNSYSGGVSVKRYFNPINAKDRTWGVRLDYNFINIKGDDAFSSNSSNVDRNLHFNNNIHEIGVAAEFHFFEFRPNRFRNIVNPYVFGGVGMIYHNPKAKDENGKRVSLIDEMVEVRKISYEKDGSGNNLLDSYGNRIATTQKYSKIVATFPMGAGVKINGKGTLAPWSVGLELNYRLVLSDFLDGVGNRVYEGYSTIYPEPEFVDPDFPTLKEQSKYDNWTNNQSRWESLAG